MHEVGIMQSALEVALEQATAEHATKIHRIAMRIGAFSGVVPDALQFAFEALSQGTMAEGADFQIKTIPGRSTCRQCKKELEIRDLASLTCATCGGEGDGIVGGREIEVSDIEIS
jgi:hydrogenase nickel incorporation protein HypA/HybF